MAAPVKCMLSTPGYYTKTELLSWPDAPKRLLYRDAVPPIIHPTTRTNAVADERMH